MGVKTGMVKVPCCKALDPKIDLKCKEFRLVAFPVFSLPT